LKSNKIIPILSISLLVIILFFIESILLWALIVISGFIFFKSLNKKGKDATDKAALVLSPIAFILLLMYPSINYWIMVGIVSYLTFLVIKKSK
jgi:hypothetical protein